MTETRRQIRILLLVILSVLIYRAAQCGPIGLNSVNIQDVIVFGSRPKSSIPGLTELPYQSALVQYVNKDKTVQVWIPESRTAILFEPPKDRLSEFRRGYIVPVAFGYTRNQNNNGFVGPYKLFVRQVGVKALVWKFYNNPSRYKSGIVHLGPGSITVDDQTYRDRIAVDVLNGDYYSFVELKISDPKKLKEIQEIKRGDTIDIEFPEREPYRVYINGVAMEISYFGFRDKTDPAKNTEFIKSLRENP